MLAALHIAPCCRGVHSSLPKPAGGCQSNSYEKGKPYRHLLLNFHALDSVTKSAMTRNRSIAGQRHFFKKHRKCNYRCAILEITTSFDIESWSSYFANIKLKYSDFVCMNSLTFQNILWILACTFLKVLLFEALFCFHIAKKIIKIYSNLHLIIPCCWQICVQNLIKITWENNGWQ